MTRIAVFTANVTVAALVALAAAFASSRLDAQVVISEILYNPPGDKDLEFVEIHNPTGAAVELSGWSLRAGVEFLFPAGSMLGPGGYLAVCRSSSSVEAAFDAPDGALIGDFEGSLANEGERLDLVDAAGRVVESLVYSDQAPWDFLADGYGASLERLCFSAGAALPENWRAGPVPKELEVSGGTPGAPNHRTLCPPAPPARPAVFISELMYHPVLEAAVEEEYEFIEIHNAGAEPVALGGWRLAGAVDFEFPAESTIGPGDYKVVASSRDKLASVEVYALEAEDILGDYERSLDNGGEKLALIGADGQGVDHVVYDDDFPWPSAADALGAGPSWLKAELLPIEKHRHLGHSLERVSFSLPSTELANWAPSPLDGPTPAKPNASARATPLPVVAFLLAEPAAAPGEVIRAGDEVRIQAEFTPRAPAGAVELEYFVEDIERADEPIETAALHDDGRQGGDLLPGDAAYSAILPGLPDNAIVRYRVRADLGSGVETVSPRPTDPFGWHAYFVQPVIETTTRTYHVFISRANWGRMYTNITGGRVAGCAPSPTWDVEMPAIFVHDGQVSDAQVRYQGSRWNRANGRAITRWTGPRPSAGPLQAMSWRISLPRYRQMEGRSVVVLNKLTQGCPGYNAGVGYRLFAEADIPSPEARFARLHVNGSYYHYAMEYERPGEEMMRRYHREMAERYPHLPREKVGHLFKSQGCNCDEGPYGWGDARALNPSCAHPRELRYAYTYDRKTHDWADNAAFVRLIDDLHAARRGGPPAIRAYFEANFDLELLMNYLAIINYSAPFDDMFQNHFWYQRLSDGKWLLTPWDLDQNFGEWQGAAVSIFHGEQGVPDNRSGWWNYLKDAFFKGFRQEFQDHLVLMNNTLLHPDRIAALVDEVTAESNPQEAAQAPAGIACSFPGRAQTFKAFALQRYQHINRLSGIQVEAGPDRSVFVGETVDLDARSSTPDPGPDVVYSWKVGDRVLDGELQSIRFDAAGEYAVTLAVRIRGFDFEDGFKVTVLAEPARQYIEKNGLVSMEAENFFANERFGSANTYWELYTETPGFSGLGAMVAFEAARTTFLTRFVGVAPELRYAVRFTNPGEYRVWIRALVKDTQNDTLNIGLNSAGRGSGDAHEFLVDPNAYLWSGVTRTNDQPQILDIARPGLQYLSLWIRESGVIIDKIIMTQDLEMTPEGSGPAESEVRRAGGPPPFVRGDANASGRIETSDAVAILFQLFRGATLVDCVDHGDVDDNGKLEITDAIKLLEFIFRRGESPRPPFPAPGYDGTADGFPCGE
jgi:hypothetical protein